MVILLVRHHRDLEKVLVFLQYVVRSEQIIPPLVALLYFLDCFAGALELSSQDVKGGFGDGEGSVHWGQDWGHDDHLGLFVGVGVVLENHGHYVPSPSRVDEEEAAKEF